MQTVPNLSRKSSQKEFTLLVFQHREGVTLQHLDPEATHVGLSILTMGDHSSVNPRKYLACAIVTA